MSFLSLTKKISDPESKYFIKFLDSTLIFDKSSSEEPSTKTLSTLLSFLIPLMIFFSLYRPESGRFIPSFKTLSSSSDIDIILSPALIISSKLGLKMISDPLSIPIIEEVSYERTASLKVLFSSEDSLVK